MQLRLLVRRWRAFGAIEDFASIQKGRQCDWTKHQDESFLETMEWIVELQHPKLAFFSSDVNSQMGEVEQV